MNGIEQENEVLRERVNRLTTFMKIHMDLMMTQAEQLKWDVDHQTRIYSLACHWRDRLKNPELSDTERRMLAQCRAQLIAALLCNCDPTAPLKHEHSEPEKEATHGTV